MLKIFVGKALVACTVIGIMTRLLLWICVLKAMVASLSWKLTYEESLNYRTVQALLMRQEAFKRLFNDGKLNRIGLYGRAMEWHKSLSDELRTMYHINKYR